MKAITVQQPYAQLLALGLKKLEHRSWHTHFRGPVAIHAGKQFAPFIRPKSYEEICKALKAYGFPNIKELPYSCVVGVGDLRDVEEIELFTGDWYSHEKKYFGGFYPERYGWLFYPVRMLDNPIPACGHQGLWNLPEDLTI